MKMRTSANIHRLYRGSYVELEDGSVCEVYWDAERAYNHRNFYYGFFVFNNRRRYDLISDGSLSTVLTGVYQSKREAVNVSQEKDRHDPTDGGPAIVIPRSPTAGSAHYGPPAPSAPGELRQDGEFDPQRE
jgi:hypothetical protein